jgi:hypothetical protein
LKDGVDPTPLGAAGGTHPIAIELYYEHPLCFATFDPTTS